MPKAPALSEPIGNVAGNHRSKRDNVRDGAHELWARKLTAVCRAHGG
ncbi:MAG: hypothetical protein ACLS3M_01830 [Collinsella sp.]